MNSTNEEIKKNTNSILKWTLYLLIITIAVSLALFITFSISWLIWKSRLPKTIKSDVKIGYETYVLKEKSWCRNKCRYIEYYNKDCKDNICNNVYSLGQLTNHGDILDIYSKNNKLFIVVKKGDRYNLKNELFITTYTAYKRPKLKNPDGEASFDENGNRIRNYYYDDILTVVLEYK